MVVGGARERDIERQEMTYKEFSALLTSEHGCKCMTGCRDFQYKDPVLNAKR